MGHQSNSHIEIYESFFSFLQQKSLNGLIKNWLIHGEREMKQARHEKKEKNDEWKN